MSTKSTIICGEDYHVYSEIFESGSVYLEINGDSLDFQTSRNRVVVRIPKHIIENILENSSKLINVINEE